MKLKKAVSGILAAIVSLSSYSAFAMSTAEFERGMKKGIEYFDKNMYYEACDEFQWFCDFNWGKMNPGQQKYALDYLDGTKAKFNEYKYMYIYSNGIKSELVHLSKFDEYKQWGWSFEKPVPQYETTYYAIEQQALSYFKQWLYFPNQVRIHNSRVAYTQDDWNNGTITAYVYFDATMLTSGYFYKRNIVVATLLFNKYTNQFSCVEIEEL